MTKIDEIFIEQNVFLAHCFNGQNSLNPCSDGMDVYQKLLEKGVIVRPLVAYKMPDFLRVSIGKHEENQRFISALATVLSALV